MYGFVWSEASALFNRNSLACEKTVGSRNKYVWWIRGRIYIVQLAGFFTTVLPLTLYTFTQEHFLYKLLAYEFLRGSKG